MFEQFKNQVLLSERFTTISLDTGFVKKSYAMADCFHRMKLELNCFAAIKLFSTKHEASNSGRKLEKKSKSNCLFFGCQEVRKNVDKTEKKLYNFSQENFFFHCHGYVVYNALFSIELENYNEVLFLYN